MANRCVAHCDAVASSRRRLRCWRVEAGRLAPTVSSGGPPGRLHGGGDGGGTFGTGRLNVAAKFVDKHLRIVWIRGETSTIDPVRDAHRIKEQRDELHCSNPIRKTVVRVNAARSVPPDFIQSGARSMASSAAACRLDRINWRGDRSRFDARLLRDRDGVGPNYLREAGGFWCLRRNAHNRNIAKRMR